jgi:GH15 family glucan-1,4-alpha-glucosidase
MAARPIGDYGLIGDTRTAALVSPGGAIDWMCLPRFDSLPVFGRLVGGPAAGYFRVGPAMAGSAAERRVQPGPPVTIALSAAHREPLVITEPAAAWRLLEQDGRRWQEWAGEIRCDSPWRAAVVRSLLTLRLLTYSPSGARHAAVRSGSVAGRAAC